MTKKKRWRSLEWWWVVVLVIGVGVIGGMFWKEGEFFQGREEQEIAKSEKELLEMEFGEEEFSQDGENPVLEVRGITRETELYQKVATLYPRPSREGQSDEDQSGGNQGGGTIASIENSSDKGKRVRVAIVPHHLLAADLIGETLVSISSLPVKKIILLAPDHFGQVETSGGQVALVTTNDWQTPFGKQDGWRGIDLKRVGAASDSAAAFYSEHGIYAVVPLVKHYFAEAELLPLILRSPKKTESELLGELVRQIKIQMSNLGVMEDEVLLIVSSDFVHRSTNEAATSQDQENIKLLGELNEINIAKIDNDCRQCWRFVREWAGEAVKINFELVNNKNSTNYGGPDVEVTSYVTGYLRW